MYSRSFLSKEGKIKQRHLSRKEFCEIGEEAYGNPDFFFHDVNILIFDVSTDFTFPSHTEFVKR